MCGRPSTINSRNHSQSSPAQVQLTSIYAWRRLAAVAVMCEEALLIWLCLTDCLRLPRSPPQPHAGLDVTTVQDPTTAWRSALCHSDIGGVKLSPDSNKRMLKRCPVRHSGSAQENCSTVRFVGRRSKHPQCSPGDRDRRNAVLATLFFLKGHGQNDCILFGLPPVWRWEMFHADGRLPPRTLIIQKLTTTARAY
jgi:hypothetical protein